MEEYNYETLKEVGKVSHGALAYAKTIVKPGVGLLDAAEKIEKHIQDKGYTLSFPVNVSINHNAAHYAPDLDDESKFEEKDVVKIDLGARKEFYLTDCAMTIDLSENNPALIEASEKALQNALTVIKAGVKVRDIGKEIEKVASDKGLKVITNLGGHGIEQEELHASVFIPNYDNGDNTALEEGQVVAIEPFITNGAGYVVNGENTQIYQKTDKATPRSAEAREVARLIDSEFLTYPFATRWAIRKLSQLSEFRVRKGITELVYSHSLEPFPVLVEKGKGLVAQSETEIIVEKDSCTIVTKE